MASFNLYIPLLTAVEGGYQNLVGDSGNYNSKGERVGTNYGIAAKTYESWIGYPPSIADMKAMTKTVALEIMKAWYWDKVSASKINNQSIAEMIADHAVNAGTGRAGRMVQEVLNNSFGLSLTVDGAIGPKTIAAINSVDQEKLHQALKDYRQNYYNAIGGEFLKVWLNRLKRFTYEKKKQCSVCGQ